MKAATDGDGRISDLNTHLGPSDLDYFEFPLNSAFFAASPFPKPINLVKLADVAASLL